MSANLDDSLPSARLLAAAALVALGLDALPSDGDQQDEHNIGNYSDAQAVPNLAKQAVRIATADAASPVGTAQFRLDFTGAADTNLATNAASLPLSEWYARTDSQTNGTVFTLLRPGKYTLKFTFGQTGAVRNTVGWVRGSAALPANPIVAGGVRVLSAHDFTGVAATPLTYTVSVDVIIADGDIDGNNNTFQVMVTNGAGATGTGLVNTECEVTITRGHHVQSLN